MSKICTPHLSFMNRSLRKNNKIILKLKTTCPLCRKSPKECNIKSEIHRKSTVRKEITERVSEEGEEYKERREGMR